MRTHAAAQLIGSRSHQCDATATYTHQGSRAYVLLDGIGSDREIADWTRTTARRLARGAAKAGSAEFGLRALHADIAAEPDRQGWYGRDLPCAVAVVAVHTPGSTLQVAWCGDSRAYLLHDGGLLEKLTRDHNRRQQFLDQGVTPGPYARNIVTSCLGEICDDERNLYWPRIGSVSAPASGRLLLASDGAYEPLEDSCRDLAAYLDGAPRMAARGLVEAAVDHAPVRADNATVLVADLDLPA